MLNNRYTSLQLNREFIESAWTAGGEGAKTHDDHMRAASDHLQASREAEQEGNTDKQNAHASAADAHMKAAKATGDAFPGKSEKARQASKDCNGSEK
jgi:hypothetical protein